MTTTVSTSKIFSAAWTVARQGASKFGGSPKLYFAEALRQAYAYLRQMAARAVAAAAAAAEAADHVAADTNTTTKVNTLATIVMGWSRECRKSFAYKFIMDNAERLDRYGAKTQFSAKQIAIIDELYAKYN